MQRQPVPAAGHGRGARPRGTAEGTAAGHGRGARPRGTAAGTAGGTAGRDGAPFPLWFAMVKLNGGNRKVALGIIR